MEETRGELSMRDELMLTACDVLINETLLEAEARVSKEAGEAKKTETMEEKVESGEQEEKTMEEKKGTEKGVTVEKDQQKKPIMKQTKLTGALAPTAAAGGGTLKGKMVTHLGEAAAASGSGGRDKSSGSGRSGSSKSCGSGSGSNSRQPRSSGGGGGGSSSGRGSGSRSVHNTRSSTTPINKRSREGGTGGVGGVTPSSGLGKAILAMSVAATPEQAVEIETDMMGDSTATHDSIDLSD
jgi:hypothetical protein